MRVVLKIKARKNVIQNRENNSKFYSGMHGWIYRKLKNTDFSELHSDNKFKLFCFSNLFKVENSIIKENEVYSVIVSSPNEMFMVALLSNINIFDIINLGEYTFELVSYKPLGRKKIKAGCVIKSETLINITVNEKGKRKFIRLSENRESFREYLAKNLIRKYNQYNLEKVDEDFNLWENIEIEEIIGSEKSVKINFIKDSDNWFNVIGARYKFKLGQTNEIQKKILGFCYDLGFGERNTFGFGFMNIKNTVEEMKRKTKMSVGAQKDD